MATTKKIIGGNNMIHHDFILLSILRNVSKPHFGTSVMCYCFQKSTMSPILNDNKNNSNISLADV